MATAKSREGKSTPLQLAHAARRARAQEIAKLTPAQRTQQIGVDYVTRALSAIRKVGMLGTAKTVTTNSKGENIYSPKFVLTDQQKREILANLKLEIDRLESKLTPGESGPRKVRQGFKFSS